MQLTRVFLKRPTLVFVFVALTFLAAIIALRSLVIQETPNSGLPGITVSVSDPGASTSDLQTQIAEPIENQLAGTPYLDHFDTTIENQQVSIAASFTLQSTDTENIANVEKALQAAQGQLPTTIAPPTIRVADPSEPTVVTLALVSKKYPETSLAAIANNSIVPIMEQIAGVSNVNVTGTDQPAFMVEADPKLLAAYNLTLTDLVGAISPNNVRPPGGTVYQPGRETTLDIRGDLPDAQSVANLPIHVTYSSGTSSSSSSSASSGGSASGGTSASGSGGAGLSSGGSGGPGTAATVAAAYTAPMPNATVAAAFEGLPSSGAMNTSTASPSPTASPAPTTSAAASYGTSGTSNSGSATSTMATGSTTTGSTTTTGSITNTSGTAATGNAATGSSAANATASGMATTGSTGAAFGSSTSSTSSGSTSTASTSSNSTTSASASVPVDTAVAPQALSSNSEALSASSTSAAEPSTTSSAFGSGSGTGTSPLVGSLQEWAVPSADKRISDVAKVLDSSVVQRVYSSQNGQPGVSLLIQKQAQASEVTVSDAVVKQIPALEKRFPGVRFDLAHVQSTFTEEQVESVEHTLVEGIALTAVVMLFFLGSWRNAVVVMVAIPTSLGVTLFVMKLMNLTLDTVSLMAMTLVIGILIDDSTVVLENVERHHAMGEEAPDAALNGRSEIGLAAIVITMVDVVVFLPIAFAGGQVGQYLSEFAVVITIATLTSLFVSFTVTPTLAGLWSMKSTWKPWAPIRWFDKRFNGLRDLYTSRWLPWAFRFPWVIVIAAAVLCILAVALVPTGLVGEEFIPAEDQGIIYAQITLPAGHPLVDTEQLMSKLEVAAKELIAPADLQYETTIAGAYSAPFGGFVQEGNVGQISIYLNQSRGTSTTSYVAQLQSRLRNLAPNATISVSAATQQGGGNQQQIDEEVTSVDGSDPTAASGKVFAALKATPGVTGTQDSATNVAPQMEVEFNRAALQSLDVSSGTAAEAVEAAFGGDVATQIETPTKGLTDIEVIYPISAQRSLSDVLAIPIRANSGGIVRLGDVASLKYSPAPLIITRENRQQIVYVTANVASGYNLSDVTKTFERKVADLKLGKSFLVKPAAQGQQDLMGQALLTLGGSLAISIVLVFFMIVALYNSYRTPFVTLFAVPLATIGALGALWITRSTLNLYSLIGMVLLVGLVTKNGILLVDYADTVRERGKSREEGIAEAAETRFRPIIMTTLAMVAGMFPLALGLEPGAQSRASLAIAVIGGLLSSLVLTLFIVPIMYRWIAPKEVKQETAFADERKPPIAGAGSPAQA
jgi:HAE1 family hydrophobic/amphiphilic exporter-1